MLLNLIRAIFTATVVASLLLGCGSDDSSDQDTESRSFLMGFTPFPYDADPATLLTVVDDVYAKLDNDADMVLHHLEEGIPWNAALADDMLTPASTAFPYSNHIRIDWETRKAKTPARHKKYLAITPLNLDRNSLAPLAE